MPLHFFSQKRFFISVVISGCMVLGVFLAAFFLHTQTPGVHAQEGGSCPAFVTNAGNPGESARTEMQEVFCLTYSFYNEGNCPCYDQPGTQQLFFQETDIGTFTR